MSKTQNAKKNNMKITTVNDDNAKAIPCNGGESSSSTSSSVAYALENYVEFNNFDALNSSQRELLLWMVKSSNSFSIRYIAPSSTEHKKLLGQNPFKYCTPQHIFEIESQGIFDENYFTESAQKFGSIMRCYHGSSLENWYSILYNSLKNYSNTKRMSNGNILGNGIYFANDVRVAKEFGASMSNFIWNKGKMFKGMKVSCVCQAEVIKSSNTSIIHNAEYIVAENSRDIRLKYLFLFCHPMLSIFDELSSRNIAIGFATLLFIFILWKLLIQR